MVLLKINDSLCIAWRHHSGGNFVLSSSMQAGANLIDRQRITLLTCKISISKGAQLLSCPFARPHESNTTMRTTEYTSRSTSCRLIEKKHVQKSKRAFYSQKQRCGRQNIESDVMYCCHLTLPAVQVQRFVLQYMKVQSACSLIWGKCRAMSLTSSCWCI